MTTELKTASVLAFERKLDPSDALFAAGNWDDRNNASAWRPLMLREKAVRGTISNRLKTRDQDPLKLDAAIENPNLQTVDVCALPHDADTLRVHFTLRVLGGCGRPSACNNAAYQDKLQNVIQAYIQAHGFDELARRYAQNLANARFLWRNRAVAEQVRVEIAQRVEGEAAKTWTFDALQEPWIDFPANAKLQELAAAITQGLRGDSYVLLEVTTYARVGNGQEVFPSQELVLDQGNTRDKKSKHLYHVDDVAAMHSQKIGNSIRAIDTWYPEEAGNASQLGPIAVEPYGSVTSQGKAYRQPKSKHDFYNLLDGWVLKDKAPSVDDQHYVVATLIRGGVFGEAD